MFNMSLMKLVVMLRSCKMTRMTPLMLTKRLKEKGSTWGSSPLNLVMQYHEVAKQPLKKKTPKKIWVRNKW